jgi:hypothetical protein
MEKIMSKTNDTAKVAEVNEASRELAAQELDCVAGGSVPPAGIFAPFNAIAAIADKFDRHH